MNTKNILTAEQNALVIEFNEKYGIKPDEIIFFKDDPIPFFSYEATCLLANKLANLSGISIEPIPSAFEDSLSLRCELTLENGKTRSAVGVSNFSETIDGEQMNSAQIYALCSARAIRNALRTASIDLLQIHQQSTTSELLDFKPKSNKTNLLAQAHILGKDAGLIVQHGNVTDKTAWYRILDNRYGVTSSNELNENQLPDFVAVLKTLVPQQQQIAA